VPIHSPTQVDSIKCQRIIYILLLESYQSFITPLTSIAEKESLKEDYNTFNSSFQLYNAHSFSQKYQKQHFVMLLPSLGNEQHKVKKNIFERGLMFFFKKNF